MIIPKNVVLNYNPNSTKEQRKNMMEEKIEKNLEPLFFVISGHSGAGKDSVIAALKQRNIPFHFVVTTTARKPRPQENEGVDYYFVSPETFKQMIEDDMLIEHAVVYGEYKGVSRAEVRNALASGKDVILRVDVQGAATIRRKCPQAVLIFLTAGDEEEIIERLKDRHTETEAKLKTRIETMLQEKEFIPQFDYLVINRNGLLEKAVDDIISIINAEHHRVYQRKVTL